MICRLKGVTFLVVLMLNNPATVSPPELWLIGCLIMILQTKKGRMIPVISMVYDVSLLCNGARELQSNVVKPAKKEMCSVQSSDKTCSMIYDLFMIARINTHLTSYTLKNK